MIDWGLYPINRQGFAIQAIFQDGLNAFIRFTTDHIGASGSCFKSLFTVTFAQPQNP
jgi:hypothetical protein